MGIKFLLICGVVLGLMVYPPLFTVRNIDVEGNGYLKKDEVINIAGVYFGEPMFRLDTLAVTRRIMNDLRIEEATVRRSLPSTIVINIKERVPIATVADDYGYLDLDHQGKIIDSYKTLKKMPIPMITGITLHDKYIGDDANNETLKQILYYLERLDAVSLNQISEVAIISSDSPPSSVASSRSCTEIAMRYSLRLSVTMPCMVRTKAAESLALRPFFMGWRTCFKSVSNASMIWPMEISDGSREST